MSKRTKTGEELLTPELLSTLDDASLLAKLAVEGIRNGRHRSICRGYGGEFEQYRDYVPGDDVKYVDWKLYARQERLCTKVFREETDMRVAVVLDGSASMGYQGSRSRCGKYRYGAMLSVCLAHLALRAGDSVGVFVHGGDGPSRSLSSGAHWSLGRLLGELTERVPSGKADWEPSLLGAEEFLGGRGMMVLISDFHDDEQTLETYLQGIRLHHRDCLAFQVLDDDELDLPFGGCVTFVDSETGQEVSSDGDDIRSDYIQAMDSFREHIMDSGLNSQSDIVLARTSSDLGSLLSEFLCRREERLSSC